MMMSRTVEEIQEEVREIVKTSNVIHYTKVQVITVVVVKKIEKKPTALANVNL